MQIILQEDVEKLGTRGQVVDVAEGSGAGQLRALQVRLVGPTTFRRYGPLVTPGTTSIASIQFGNRTIALI